jgi:dihydroxyacid dehydratase/phosphogluconate dehydratase
VNDDNPPGPPKRRSQAWFGRLDRDGFIYRSWLKNRGIPHDQFDGRPVIGICNTYSELTPAIRISARWPTRSRPACGRPAAFRSNSP